MWPWGHAAIGYVLFTTFSLGYRWKPLTTKEALVVVAGTQIPDLVDKPLSWSFGLLETGRTLGHSLVVWVIVAAIVGTLAVRSDRERGGASLLGGYFVGAVTDVPAEAVSDLSRATFLAWPLLPSPTYPAEPSFAFHLAQVGIDDVIEGSLWILGIAVLQIALAYFLRDGRNPLSDAS